MSFGQLLPRLYTQTGGILVKKAVILGERKAGLVQVPDPQPREDWVVVKVHVAPMCTEYKAFLAGHEAGFLGHEAAGEVVAVAQPCRVKVGDRVVVMPLYPCGKCALCIAGDYIHCENNHDFETLLALAPDTRRCLVRACVTHYMRAGAIVWSVPGYGAERV